MRRLPVAARLFVGAVIALGLCTLVVFAPRSGLAQPGIFVAFLLLSAATAAFTVSLPLGRNGTTMSLSYAVDVTALLLLGPNEAMLIGMASAWSQCTVRVKERNPVHRTLFSMASLVLTVQASGHARALVALAWPWPGTWAGEIIGLVGTATVYFLCNTLLVSTAVALSTRRPVLGVWHDDFLWSAPGYFVGAAVGAGFLALADRSLFWVALAAAIPLGLTFRAYKVYLQRIQREQRHVREISDLHLATIEALALAIDAKDQTSHTHIRRIQVYAAGLASALGMSDYEVHGVRTAALLHDIGKLAVPEHILSKPGPLTHEEFQKVRIHPQVGANIVAQVPFPYPVAPVILGHHERWDGRGYPAGLRAEEIPLGARILAVVDYFDALTSERPYHKAMSEAAALRLLKQEGGRGLDPVVVARFVELLPSLRAQAEQVVRVPSPAPRALLGELPPPAAEVPPANVFEDIALAHREIYALYEIAQAIGTTLGVAETMQLIASKLNTLIPFSCCALFLEDEDGETIRCRFAIGTEAEIIQRVAVRTGHGMTGWVSRNRRPLVNGRPSTDLEAAEEAPTSTRLASALVCPLLVNERFIGTLSLYDAQPACFTEDHRRLLERISEQAAAVIYNSILFEQTQEESLTDPLTGLPNTRFLFMHVARELARAARLKSEVSMLVMDLDDFKEINDHHGHHVGDRALQAVADALRNAIRPYDVCARYAGDEFIVVLSGCGAEEAERKRQELQVAVSGLVFDARPGVRLPIGISAGAAVFPSEGESYERLLAMADGRMYRDKARRKRGYAAPTLPHLEHLPVVLPADLSDIDLERAATGVL
jgi:diguanylate cyclase (GGDEF)-like protein/putative nucleotidyltransferase with HDIG domain